MSEILYIGMLGTFVLIILFIVFLREWVDERRGGREGEIEIASKFYPDGRYEKILLVMKMTKEGSVKYVVRREFKGRRLLKEEVITKIEKVVVGRGSLWIGDVTSSSGDERK